MRQQAKPFTVEIKKSRKSSAEPQPLFRSLDLAIAEAPAAAAAADKLFGRRSGTADSPDIARVFGVAPSPEPARPATRILPDLTARPVGPAAIEEAPKARKLRMAKSKGPRVPKAKPLPVTLVEAPARREVVAAPMPAIRVNRRPKDQTGLARAERWKRRLPRHAR